MYNYYLIIDGNYLFYRTLFTVKNYSAKGKLLSDDKSKGIFFRKVVTDFVSVYNDLKPDHIIFTKDSKSWRKEYFIDYKATREKSDDIDWDEVFKLMDEFTYQLAKLNIVLSKIDTFEGDDLISLWSKKLNNEGKSVIIVSADTDLNQLVKLNENNTYTIAYNIKSDSKKITAPIGFKSKLMNYTIDDIDIFNLKNNLDISKLQNIKNIINNVNYEEVEPSEILLHKVLKGDDTDNIPSIFVTEVNGKRKRICNKDANKVIAYLKDTYSKIDIDEIKFDKNLKNEIRLILEKSSKLKIDKDLFINNLERNFKLIHLDESEYTQDFIDLFNKSLVDINYNKRCRSISKNSLLEGTKYTDDSITIYSNAY